MVLELYKNLSDKSEIIVIEAEKPLKEQLLNIDFGKYIVIANGKRVDADYIPHKDDVILMRRIPEGISGSAIIGIIAIVAAVAAGIVVLIIR